MRLRGIVLLLFVTRAACSMGETMTIAPDTVRHSSVCIGTQLILTSSVTGDEYSWTKNDVALPDNKRTLVVTADEAATYVCSVMERTVSAQYNLMANGDFESNPPVCFTSDYLYAGWDPAQYYNTHGGASNLYAVTHDASYFWRDFYPVRPHAGRYFALFDAGKSGYAWKADTKANPNLILEKDSMYLFSYWAAYPNKDPNNSPARLQFVIVCKDAGGQSHTYNLGAVHTLGKVSPLNAWELQEVTWKAPMSSADVMIGVYDENQSEGGNDFCLDDIMFQKTTSISNIVIHQTFFIIEPYDCNPPCPALTEEVQRTVVCDTLLPYVWQGYTFTRPDTVDWVEYSQRGCDSVLHRLVLDTVHCQSVPPVCNDDMVYAKWTDVLFCNNAGNRYVAWQWYCNDLPLEGETGQFLWLADTRGVATPEAVFHVCARTSGGTQECSCPLCFDDIPRSADTYSDMRPYRFVCREGVWMVTLTEPACDVVRICSATGMLVAVMPLVVGDNCLSALPKGLWIAYLCNREAVCMVQKLLVK